MYRPSSFQINLIAQWTSLRAPFVIFSNSCTVDKFTTISLFQLHLYQMEEMLKEKITIASENKKFRRKKLEIKLEIK